jgi:P-type Cu2+ transporter
VSVAHAFWTDESAGLSRAVFAAQGMRCAACGHSIERAIRALPGVERADVNVATASVSVDWRAAEIDLPRILQTLTATGFTPVPLSGLASAQAFERERRTALKRIGLAGLSMMQVMMYVLGVYVATPDSIDPAVASYLRYVGLLLTTPVLLYSGAPFFTNAMRDLRRHAIGMDVPVALALTLAYGASVINTIRGSGETYFDSVTMFIFFLSTGRYVEMMVRQRSLSLSEAASRSMPAAVSRIGDDGTIERIPVHAVAAGDRLSIPKGGVIPVDARLASSDAWIDESLISGESTPVFKRTGNALLGGAVNAGSVITVTAQSAVTNSTLASIIALLERAQSMRPPVVLASDRMASTLVAGILILAGLVTIAWLAYDPSRAFSAALAVLVVTCPCALSLASPVAVAAASLRLARLGLLVTRADALERLSRIDTVVLDKTGTLTFNRPTIGDVTLLGKATRSEVLALGAALERASSHPIASAFAGYANPLVVAEEVTEMEGRGISGMIHGEFWRLGRFDFVAELFDRTVVPPTSDDALYLGSSAGVTAAFELAEQVKPRAREAVKALHALGITVVIASGDRAEAVTHVAAEVGIAHARARLDPAQKTAFVRELQAQGRRVLTIGDGINDGPVLAVSDVSCAMGEGSGIAQAAADFLLLNDSFSALGQGVVTARRMQQVIRQNLRWALAYNLAAVPLAALTVVPPWLAAIGMSASSLLVVLNARRIAHSRVGA